MVYLLHGGGLILIPAFIHIFKMEDKLSRASAVACILPMVITSSIFYYEKNYINWEISFLCAIGGTIGAVVGTKLLQKIKTKYIRFLYTIFLFYISIKMFL